MKAPASESEAVAQFKPFVVQCALQFEGGGISRDDLIQEGLIAVATAFRSWRPDGGANFLTWIRRPVRLAMLAWCRKQKRAGGSLRGGRRSRKGEGVSLVSMDAPTSVSHAVSYMRKLDFPIDQPPTLHELIGDPDDTPDILALRRLPGLLVALDERQRKVLRLRFVSGMTHEQVGKKMRISRSLARHIEQTAIERLKDLMVEKGIEA